MSRRNDITAICPINDGESRTIVDICCRLGIDVRISQQPWGARLDLEPKENLQTLKNTVVIIEMPSPEMEEELRRQGHRVVIIDHHFYPKMHLDRRRPISSLEQFAEFVGYELTRKEFGIAVNDRDYIFGLIEQGFSQEEIVETRKFDLESQGVPVDEIQKVQQALKTAPIRNGITILRLDFTHAGYAQDFLVLENPSEVRDLLILGGRPLRKANFYGDPEKVEALSDLGEWMGGGGKSKFWGTTQPDVYEILRRLNIPLDQEIETLLQV